MLKLVLIVSVLCVASRIYAAPPMMDPTDRCIYTCIYCFKDNMGVVCANECLARNGKIHPVWIKFCPQMALPQFYLKMFEPDDDKSNDIQTNTIA